MSMEEDEDVEEDEEEGMISKKLYEMTFKNFCFMYFSNPYFFDDLQIDP